MKLKNLLKGAVRAAGALVGSSLGGPAGAAIGAGLATKLTGGSNQDALLGGVISGLGAYALPKVGGRLGLSSDSLVGAGVPAGAGGDMRYINAGGPSAGARALNFATSPAGLGALAAGTAVLAPGEPLPEATMPARDNRTLEEMGYDTSPLQRERIQYEDTPFSYGETGSERLYFRHGGSIARYANGGSVGDPSFDAAVALSDPAAANALGIESAQGDYGTGDAGDSGVSADAPAEQGSIFSRGLDALASRATDMVQNPGRTAANAVVNSNPIGLLANAASYGLTGKSIGAHAMGALQGLTGYGKGSGIPGDADGDGVITPGDDYANYGNQTAQMDAPGSVTYLDTIPGKVDEGEAAPGTGASMLQPVTDVIAPSGRTFAMPSPDWTRYGEIGPESRFFMARGGLARGRDFASMARAAYERGGKVAGPGDGQSDDIPAMLSDGEYVMDAESVAALGDGSNEAGARKLDEMRKRLRAHKRSAPKGKIPPKAKSIGAYMGGRV